MEKTIEIRMTNNGLDSTALGRLLAIALIGSIPAHKRAELAERLRERQQQRLAASLPTAATHPFHTQQGASA